MRGLSLVITLWESCSYSHSTDKNSEAEWSWATSQGCMVTNYQSQNSNLRVSLQSSVLKPLWGTLGGCLGWAILWGYSRPMVSSTVLLVQKLASVFCQFIQGRTVFSGWLTISKCTGHGFINHLNHLQRKIQLFQKRRLVISTEHTSFSLCVSTQGTNYKSESSGQNGIRINIPHDKFSFPLFLIFNSKNILLSKKKRVI